MTSKNIKQLGFTLVELLIVIALLGIIALIVIAAINPIEQANRARDTGLRSDGSQMISAIDRYFAAKMQFPWTTYTEISGLGDYSDESSFGFMNAAEAEVGLCGDDTCSIPGALMTADELKPEFQNRTFVSTDALIDQLWIGKATGASSSVYVCYIPKARSNRTRAIDEEKIKALDPANGTFAASVACTDAGDDWASLGCYVCIPD